MSGASVCRWNSILGAAGTTIVLNGIRVIAYAGVLLINIGECERQESPQKEDNAQTYKFTKPWVNDKFRVLLNNSKEFAPAEGKRAEFSVQWHKLNLTIPLTAFKSATSGRIWIGPEQQYYFEGNDGISGFHTSGCSILFCDSMVPSTVAPTETLDEVLVHFERELTRQRLLDSHNSLLSVWPWKPEDVEAAFKRRRVSTPDGSDPRFVMAFASNAADSPQTKVASVLFASGDLQINFTNARLGYQGTVWVEPKTRNVAKMVIEPVMVEEKKQSQ